MYFFFPPFWHNLFSHTHTHTAQQDLHAFSILNLLIIILFIFFFSTLHGFKPRALLIITSQHCVHVAVRTFPTFQSPDVRLAISKQSLTRSLRQLFNTKTNPYTEKRQNTSNLILRKHRVTKSNN